MLLRLFLLYYGYPFFKPSDYIFAGFYQDVQPVREKQIRREDDVKDILILGGSVVSQPFSHMESRLDTILQKYYGNTTRLAFYNIASPGHTSRDNVIKYRLLADKQFDLVIYYEAINENRANNVPPEDFRDDYTHMEWYRDIEMLQRHPEMNVTVIPFLTDKLISSVRDVLKHKIYISVEQVTPEFAKFGGNIKTREPYRRNIEEIIRTAHAKGDKLLLMSYASYFPPNVTLTGQQKDMQHFTSCHFATPAFIWGKPEHVKKGIDIHNQAIRMLAGQYQTLFLDMENRMPKDGTLFCDVCHLSEPGAQRFANEIAEFIVRQKILE